MSESLSVKDKLDEQNCPNNESLTMEDLNNNFLTSRGKSSSDEALFKTGNRTADSEKQCEEQRRHEDQHENQDQQENQNISQNDDEMDNSVVTKKKKSDQSNRSGDGDTLPGNKNSEDAHQKSRSDSRERLKSNSDGGRFGSEKESNKKSKTSKTSKESSKEGKESFSFESSDKYSKTLKLTNVKDDTFSGIPRSSEALNKKRKKSGKEKHATLKYKQECENEGKEIDPAEPSMSFESYLNYDVNVFKRKERFGVNKPPKKIKTAVKEATKDPGMRAFKTPVMSVNVTSPKQVYLTMILKAFSF